MAALSLTHFPYQPQGHVQILLSMLHGLSPQQAVDAPRFCISAGLGDAEVRADTTGNINSVVFFEDTFNPDVVAKLRGKPVTVISYG